MIQRLVLVVAILLTGMQASAADALKLLNLTNVTDGTYLLKIDKGVVSLTQAAVIEPGVTPNPPPGNLTERAKAIKAAADKVTGDPKRAETAQLLAELYRQVANLITNGTLKGDQVMLALKMATDAALATPALKASWQPVRDVVTLETTKLAQKGAKDAEYATYFLECADGYDASAALGKTITPEMLQFIMMIIKLILSLLGK